MTLYELMSGYRGDDISVVISVYDMDDYDDDDIRTTAFAIQSNEPYCENDYVINKAYVKEWYFVMNEFYVEVEIHKYHTCEGCKYFNVCGDLSRTEHCEGKY